VEVGAELLLINEVTYIREVVAEKGIICINGIMGKKMNKSWVYRRQVWEVVFLVGFLAMVVTLLLRFGEVRFDNRGAASVGFLPMLDRSDGGPCEDVHFPVCGTNGVSYGNTCKATKARAVIACTGVCPCEE
jgi:hypothetical protein